MSSTAILSCKCSHEYQDTVYGKGRRLHNRSGKKENSHYACTVCGDKKSAGSSSTTEKKKK